MLLGLTESKLTWSMKFNMHVGVIPASISFRMKDAVSGNDSMYRIKTTSKARSGGWFQQLLSVCGLVIASFSSRLLLRSLDRIHDL